MRSVLVFLFFFLLFGCYSQDVPLVNEQHPRIELGKERFDWLKANISSGECQETYQRFKSAYDRNWVTSSKTYMVGSDSTQWNYEFGSSDAFQMSRMTAFLLKLGTDGLALKRCEFIISRYVEYLNSLNFDNYSGDTKENLLRDNCNYGAILLDWTYNDVPQVKRQQLSKALFRVLEYFMDNYVLTSSGNSYVTSHNIYNCGITMHAALALHGADGLSSGQMSDVNSWYKTLVGKWENGILPAFAYFRDDDGGWNWGAAYSMFGLPRQYQFFDDMKIATGTDYYQEQSWIRESINQYWYFYRPDNYTIHLGDAVINLDQANRVMYRHAAEFGDERSQYLVQKYGAAQYLNNSNLVFQKLLFKDFEAPTVSHPEPPLDWWADKTGLAVSRTSWNEDATMIWYYCAPAKRADHEHRDNNHFVIIKDKPQILDAGHYDSYATNHYNNYYSRTIAHNSICVFDGSESYRAFGRSVSNDGGQIWTDRLENVGDVTDSDHRRGEWLKFAAGDDYAYYISDAADSYASNKLDRFERRLLYHKPDRVLVLDHLHLLNVSSRERKAKYINHFANRPVINGQVVSTTVSDKIISYNGRDYKASHGNGNVAIRTLLPESTTTTLIGGSAYEYWVNGTNYPPDNSPNFDSAHPGSWRIEVEPTQVSEDLVYLHTIKIGDNQNPSNAGGKLFKNESTIGVDWENHLYLFHAKGDTLNSSYMVNPIEGNRTIKIFALDMQTNNSFGVFVDDELQRVGDSNEAGIFEITVDLSEGTHQLVVRDTIAGDPNPDTDPDPDPTPDPGDEAEREVKVYPNPSNGIFTILIEHDEVKEFRLSTFDSTGRKVMEYLNSGNRMDLNMNGLSSGVYYLLIQYLDKQVKRKIVLVDK
ncbi:T9SS type A sorting domain-containing protein [Marinifilum fragile]|uniref:T9SS type A sorting domain-containing protein n=1 Tax=Marinifilum fragile TaxID=570161 RepID=UPI002AA6AFB4|nr:T9SS type A sorting domain-containing protein [Marinifilum fragile]